MSQWFSGVGPLTPGSPAQAVTLILEGDIMEHEASIDPDSEANPTGQVYDQTSYKSAFPLIHTTPTETVCHLCFFPSGVHWELFKCHRLYCHQLLPQQGLIGFVFRKHFQEQTNEPSLQVYENGHEIAGAELKKRVNCIGFESRDRVALGHDGHVDIYDRQKNIYEKTEVIKMTRHSPVVVKFCGEVLLIGTKLGSVSGYNVRTGQFTWTFQAEGRGRVYDIQMKKGIVYVSGSGGLWMWDVRGTDKVRKEFLGHRNRGKKVTFDTNTELGLLAAGGDDGVVRLWSCRSGEDPMGELKLSSEMPVSVRFVRETREGEEALGLWISTKRKLYTCIVAPNDLYEDPIGIVAPQSAR